MFLKDCDKQLLKEKGIDLGDDPLDNELLQRAGENSVVRAIVKGLAPRDTGVNASSLRKIRSNIRWLKKLKIYNRDIRVANFKGGQLVDFGSALTEPHCI